MPTTPAPPASATHLTCVVVDGHGVVLRGPSGSGKSDLALRLIDGGAHLVGDDYCILSARDGRLIAAPAPALAGLLEVRGLGIVRLPHVAEVAVSLIVELAPPPAQTPDRLPKPASVTLCGVAVRAVALNPFEASAPAKVRVAVRVATGDSELAT